MFSDFVSGFTNSPLEIAIVLTLMVAGVVVLLATAHHMRRRRQRRLEEEAERTFAELAGRKRLSERDVKLLHTLARHLEEPHRRYLLLRNQALFDRTAALCERSGDVTPSEVSSLRVRLGFGGSRAGVAPAATSELPEGAALILRRRSGDGVQTMNTLIKRQLPEALVVEVPESGTLEKGTELLLYYFDDSGVYRVTTRIIEISHAALYLAHAEQLQRLQRREFDRAEVRLPAVIRDTDEDEGRYVRGTLLDVGGGGAKVSSSGRTFANGTHVDLALNPDNARSLRVTGVVRHNRDHVHHIQFDSLSQRAQDRLYQIVFERERSRARER